MARSSLSAKTWSRSLAALALVIGVAVVAVWLTHAAGTTGVQPTAPGNPMPDLAGLEAIGNGGDLVSFDLSQKEKDGYLLLFYWMAGHAVSEDNLLALQDWARQHDEATLVSVVPSRGKTAAEVAARAQAIGVDVPIIWDNGYKIQSTLRVGNVPHVTVIDPDGIVRVAGAASPRHEILPETTLVEYLDRAIAGKGAPTVSRLSRYYPVTELIGEQSMDFTLSEVPSNKPVRFYDKVTDGKLTLLVFWSPDCGHCKEELPELNSYLLKNRDRLNIVGVTKTKDPSFRQRTADFIRLHNIQFPTVEDPTEDVWNKYKIVTTPTTVVVSPDGQVETVLLGSSVDLERELGPVFARVNKTSSTGA